MVVTFDTYYYEDKAKAICLGFNDWTNNNILTSYSEITNNMNEYVTKTNFALINRNKRAVLRGKSKNPRYITSVGIDLDEAAELIRSMHGAFRMPTILKELDRLTKEK